jgi:hypothetical protein
MADAAKKVLIDRAIRDQRRGNPQSIRDLVLACDNPDLVFAEEKTVNQLMASGLIQGWSQRAEGGYTVIIEPDVRELILEIAG